jgi:hypothetical protein
MLKRRISAQPHPHPFPPCLSCLFLILILILFLFLFLFCKEKNMRNAFHVFKLMIDFVFMHYFNLFETKQFAANAQTFGFRSTTNRNNTPLHVHVSLPPMVEQVLDGTLLEIWSEVKFGDKDTTDRPVKVFHVEGHTCTAFPPTSRFMPFIWILPQLVTL